MGLMKSFFGEKKKKKKWGRKKKERKKRRNKQTNKERERERGRKERKKKEKKVFTLKELREKNRQLVPWKYDHTSRVYTGCLHQNSPS